MDISIGAVSDLLISSSSSDEEDVDGVEFLLREFNKKPKVENFIEDVVQNYSEEEFRVKRRVSDILIQNYESSAHFKTKIDSGGKKEIAAKTQMLAFIWFAGNKDSYREVASLFNISISTMYRILENVLEFLFEVSPNFIKCPTTQQEKLQTAAKFEQIANIPGVLGCIDGCYIRVYITKPANKIRSTYINRHDLVSLTLQGICDSEKRFIDVLVGSPSKMHDSRVFQLSFISKDLARICGTQYHLLGDAAYPLREYLLTPYKNTGNLTRMERIYNKKHCQTRVKMENSFSLIKARFRQLLRIDFHRVERMCKFILACCVLHNLCIDEEDLWDDPSDNAGSDDDGSNIPSASDNTVSDFELKELGKIKINRIKESFL